MDRYFGFTNIPRLGMFSKNHIIAIFLILFFWIFTIYIIREINRRSGKSDNNIFRITLAWLLIFSEVAFTCWHLFTGHFSVKGSLPLQLCDITAFTSALMLLTGSNFFFQITYFAGISGALQAIVTPASIPDFPHFNFLNFFIYHALLILGGLYMLFIRRYTPDWKSMWKVFGILNVYMIIIYSFNKITASNYLYINHPPRRPNLIDPFLVNIFGPSPYYIIGLEILVIIIFLLMMLPFGIAPVYNKYLKKNNSADRPQDNPQNSTRH